MQPDAAPPLALLLLLAARWFDRQLLPALAQEGWPQLTSAQSLLFAHLDPHGGVSPAELARRLGTTRQAVADLVQGLVRLGVLDVVDDPVRKRGRLVVLTRYGADLAGAAERHLRRLEDEVGEDRVTALRQALAALELPPGGVDGAAH